MKKKTANILSILILAVISFIAGYFLCNRRFHKSQKTIKSDTTIYFVATDTQKVIIPEFVDIKIVDTLYLPVITDSVMPISIEQKHFHEKGIYDIWVSGYKTRIDSAKFYNPVKNIVISNEIEREYKRKKINLFVGGNINYHDKSITPGVGVSMLYKDHIMYDLNWGMMHGSSVISFGVKFNIF